MPVERADIAAWLLKCNPQVWNLEAFLADGNDYIDSWSVADNYRTGLMEPGDRVLFWVSGPAAGAMPRGIWGFGHVTGYPRATVDIEDEEAEEGREDYWLNLKQAARVRFFVPVYVTLFDKPVAATSLMKTPGLRSLEVVRAPQMSNPSFISPDELELLTPLMPDWPEHQPTGEEEIVVGPGGAGFGDPLTNLEVEEAAMEHGGRHFQNLGWDIEDVSLQRAGWDLTCTKPNSEVLHVEVKGLSGWQRVVLLTANEVTVAGEDKRWRLAVVTRALSSPELALLEPGPVLSATTPYLHRADLR